MNYWEKHCELTDRTQDFGFWLCEHFGDDELFALMKPDTEEKDELAKKNLPSVFWGRETFEEKFYTPLRQNIVLFMAAMNNEL